MTLYQVKRETRSLHRITPNTFRDVAMRERQDLQVLLKNNPQIIEPDLFVFAEEFSSWEGSLRRADLLALDSKGNIVVVELKIDRDGSHMDLQAIRYAAMLSLMDFDAVVKEYEGFLNKAIGRHYKDYSAWRDRKPENARNELLTFLNAEKAESVVITNVPRIVLVSSSFSKEITTTALWLNDCGLDVRCIEVKPYKLGDNIYLDIDQIVPSRDDYRIIVQRKIARQTVRLSGSRGPRTIPLLIEQGVLEPGTRLRLIKLPRAGLEVSDDRAKSATFLGESGQVKWEYDEQSYSLSNLCAKICASFSGDPNAGPFRGSDYWAIEGEGKTLTERARELGFNSGDVVEEPAAEG